MHNVQTRLWIPDGQVDVRVRDEAVEERASLKPLHALHLLAAENMSSTKALPTLTTRTSTSRKYGIAVNNVHA